MNRPPDFGVESGNEVTRLYAIEMKLRPDRVEGQGLRKPERDRHQSPGCWPWDKGSWIVPRISKKLVFLLWLEVGRQKHERHSPKN